MPEQDDFKKAVSAYNSGQFDAAQTLFKQVFEKTADKKLSASSAFWLGTIYEKTSKYSEAIHWFGLVAAMQSELELCQRARKAVLRVSNKMSKPRQPEARPVNKPDPLGSEFVLPDESNIKEFERRKTEKDKVVWWSGVWGKYPLWFKIVTVFWWLIRIAAPIAIVVSGYYYVYPIVSSQIKEFNAEWYRTKQSIEQDRIRLDAANEEVRRKIEEDRRKIEQYQRDYVPPAPAPTPPPERPQLNDWCPDATTLSERTICGNSILKGLDTDLRIRYRDIRASLPRDRRGHFAGEQKDWDIHVRDACGSNVGCLRQAYHDRIGELNNYH
jgi:hypothetical protein